MSSSFISCVRENSPTLKFDLSAKERSKPSNSNTLPPPSTKQSSSSKSSTMADPREAANNEQQKKRRFHPLRNLRRIFRRRTITSDCESGASRLSPVTSSSEKNLKSTTLSSISNTVSASSPSSPLTHQQLNEAYLTKSLPKSKSYGSTITGNRNDSLESEEDCDKKNSKDKNKRNSQSTTEHRSEMYSASSSGFHNASSCHQRQSIGVAVLPTSRNFNVFAEKHKLNSVSDSSQDLDITGNESVSNRHSINSHMAGTSRITNDSSNGGEMSGSQRSLNEGRLLDSDYGREGLSQSHDSVFSESATASSLSIVLKAELADALRKRRNRPDTSEEDLGLPSSPTSPNKTNDKYQIKNTKHNANETSKTTNSNDLSSLSLSSVQSVQSVGIKPTASTPNNSFVEDKVHTRTTANRFARAVTISTDAVLPRNDGIDDIDSVKDERFQLSHAAAKHKMAIRPTKKKMPSRLHRRTLDITTSIPESMEDVDKSLMMTKGAAAIPKSSTLPLNMSAKGMAEQLINKDLNKTATKQIPTAKKPPVQSKVLKETNSSLRQNTNPASPPKKPLVSVYKKEASSNLSEEQAFKAKEEFRTEDRSIVVSRTAKRTIWKTKADEEESDLPLNEAKKLLLSSSSAEVDMVIKEELVASEKLEKNKLQEEETSSNGVTLSSYSSNSKMEKVIPSIRENLVKYRSGPAARQRYLPKELDSEGKGILSQNLEIETKKSHSSYEAFESTSLVREFTKFKAQTSSSSLSSLKSEKHYEKKAKIIGLSPFQQKVTRSTDAIGYNNSGSNSSSSMETSTDFPSDYYEEKQRHHVEKSKSFRALPEEETASTPVHRNMPSLPDLSLNIRIPNLYSMADSLQKESLDASLLLPEEEKCLSLGFEINDNNLLKSRNQTASEHDKNIIVTTEISSKLISPKIADQSADKEISEIEDNIDKIVKSPFILKTSSISKYEQKPPSGNSKPERPKTLSLADKRKDKVKVNQSPSPSVVPLREKAKTKENERMSAPVTFVTQSDVSKTTRRSSSVVDSNDNSDVPEFMKIQLNRVDPERIIRSNVVLTTNPNRDLKSTDDSPEANKISDPISSGEDSSPSKVQKGNAFARSNAEAVRNIEIRSPAKSRKGSDAITNVEDSNPVMKAFKLSEDVIYSKTFASKGLNASGVSIKVVFKQDEPISLRTQNESIVTKISNVNESTKLASPSNGQQNAKNLNKIQANVEVSQYPGSKVSSDDSNNFKIVLTRNNNNGEFKSQRNSYTSETIVNGVSTTTTSNTSPTKSKLKSPTEDSKRNSILSEALKSSSSLDLENIKINEGPSTKANVSSPLKEKIASPTKAWLSPEKTLNERKSFIVGGLTKTVSSVMTSPDKCSNSSDLALNALDSVKSSIEVNSLPATKVSLQERKRLFMASEEKASHITDLGLQERKKSINDDLFSRPLKTTNETSPVISRSRTPSLSPSSPTTPSDTSNQNVVVLRKKSLVANSLANGGNRLISDKNDNDGTPELMKVFARRSLKLKDEDIQAIHGKVNETLSQGASPQKKLGSTVTTKVHPNIDSDKENQSASEEKLDKIAYESISSNGSSHGLQNSVLNRNSVADFRTALNKFGSNNSSNPSVAPINTNNTKPSQANAPTKVPMPDKREVAHSLKISLTFEQNNNNNLKPSNSISSKLDDNQQILKSDNLGVTVVESSSNHFTNKSIERSATISEFKAIHQRRAEWEQRVKESFK